ncbi:MAG: hypothetical protein ACHQQ3_13100, partial [Gemmatimonadales bacterium]
VPAAPEPSRPAGTSHIALVRHGELVGRITTEWSTTRAGASMQRKRLTLYREGMPPRTFDLPLDDRAKPRGGRVLASPVAYRPGTSLEQALSAGPGGESCDGEFSAMFDAIDAYWSAGDALGACGGGLGCAGASMSMLEAWGGLALAAASLTNCLET